MPTISDVEGRPKGAARLVLAADAAAAAAARSSSISSEHNGARRLAARRGGQLEFRPTAFMAGCARYSRTAVV